MSKLVINHIVCVLVFMGVFAFTANASSELQLKAEKAYADKKYSTAIEAYNDLMAQEGVSYQLHYNLGNAYFKNKQLGMAIYQYELANKLQPNQEDVLNNLKIANSKTIDQIEGKNNFFINSIKTGLVHALSLKGWTWLNILSLIGALTLFFIFYASKALVIKQASFFMGLTLSVIFIITFFIAKASKNEKNSTDFAVILKPEVKALDEPIKSSSSKFTLHEGTKVRVIETNSDFVNIKLDNGNEAWLAKEDVGLF